MSKKRLDQLMVERGLATSREKAKALIMSGVVFVDQVREDKAGSFFEETKEIEVKGRQLPYVSRGGLKLEKAFASFPIDIEGCVCGDIGASTGGFTDCMLQNGAAKVYAIDVGHGQLDWKLRSDPRVVTMEKTNVRYVTREMIDEAFDFASIDVSFISLKLVLPVVRELTSGRAGIVALIKPQFEAGREQVGKKGVVRDPKVHLEVIERTLALAKELELPVAGLTFSPIRGPEGNIEYLLYLRKGGEGMEPDAEAVVEEAFSTLQKKGTDA